MADDQRPDWAHQTRSVFAVMDAIDRGCRAVCLTVPTGGGKTRIAARLVEVFVDHKKRVAFYTNRRALIDQSSGGFTDFGLSHGVRAAGYEKDEDYPFQVCSIQTEHSRSVKRGTWALHPADLVIVDECHQQKEDTAREIFRRHREAGAAVVGLSATPVDLAGVYDELIVGATNSELRECGALVEARHFGPSEPDWAAFKGLQAKCEGGGAITEKEATSLCPPPQIWGHVWPNWKQSNPDGRPTILFGPDVKGSAWYAEQFTRQGVPAAHIDGERVWVGGEWYRNDPSGELRRDIIGRSKDGKIVVLCNRFVLREGIDCPWLSHGIFATVFSGLQSYIQSGGRLLRSAPGKECATIQDHGGHWWRFGSLNEDRTWELDLPESAYTQMRASRGRKTPSGKQPFTCPRCRRVWVAGTRCNPARGGCGFELPVGGRTRPVLAADGTMRLLGGPPFRPRRESDNPVMPRHWQNVYWAARKSEKWDATFLQAFAFFAQKNGWVYPNPAWPLMPKSEKDACRAVRDVPMSRLVGYCSACDKCPCQCAARATV